MPEQLMFTVEHQTIRRTDCFEPAKGSQNYLYAHFEFFTDDWSGVTKTALFRNSGSDDTYSRIIDAGGSCPVPHEALSGEGGYLVVSVFGGTLITANTAKVFLQETGYVSNPVSSEELTPTVYQQIISLIDQNAANIDGGTFDEWFDEWKEG